MPKNFAQYMVPDKETIMAVPRVIGVALKRPLRIEILHACEKAMINDYRSGALRSPDQSSSKIRMFRPVITKTQHNPRDCLPL